MSIQQYLQQVGMHIQSKEARNHVTEELNGHLQDAKMSYMRSGETEQAAEMKAVEAMGSSMQLGRKMNALHRPKTDWLLIGLFVVALGLGFLPIWLENAVYGHELGHLYGMKAFHIGICAVVVAGLYFVDYRKLWYWRGAFMFGVICTVFLVGKLSNYQMNGEIGLQIGPLVISEGIFIPLFIVAWGILFSNKKRPLYVFVYYFMLALTVIMYSLSIKMVILFTVISFCQFFFSYYSKREKWLVFAGAIILFTLWFTQVAMKSENIMLRFKAFINPEAYADTAGYIILLIQNIRQAAGWSGNAQLVELPSSYTDFALVSILQGLGYGGVLVVVIVLFSLLVKLMWNSWMTKQRFAKQLVVGTSMYYGFVLLYIVAMLFGFVPLSGLGVPFVSYDFTDLLVCAILIGFVLSVYRRKSLAERMQIPKGPQQDAVDVLLTVVREEKELLGETGKLPLNKVIPLWKQVMNRWFE